MAIAWGGSPETVSEKNLAHEWIAETDNIKDIKENLKTLKSDILIKIKTDKAHEYLWTKVTDNDELINKALDQQFALIDAAAESKFDIFAHDHEDELNAIIEADDATAPALLKSLETEFATYLFTISDIKDTVTDLQTLAGDLVKFELKDLRAQVLTSTTKNNSTTGTGNVFLNNLGEWTTEDKDKVKNDKQYYVAPYEQKILDYTTDNMDIADIYSDKKLPKYMEAIFDNETKKELHRGTFRINLGKEDGLGGIIIAIREAIKVGTSDTPDEESNAYKLYTELTNGIWQDPGLDISRKQLKKIIDSGLLKYTRAWWLDNELSKVAKILSNAQRADLDTFASLIQSKDDVYRSVKEWNNALNFTWQNREKAEKWEIQTSRITWDNVLAFLCDFNSDGTISTEYKKKNDKKQEHQWDVGNLSWPQVMFTIEQAIKVKNVELGTPQWEQLVIQNIVKNMQISDSRDDIKTLPLQTMQWDLSKCTKANLAEILNWNVDEWVIAMPEMKSFFLDAITKINGWSNEVNPDLYDTLVGKDVESVIDIMWKEWELRAALDKVLEESEDPDIIEAIKLQWLVRVRQTFFTKIMSWLDNLEITATNQPQTSLQASWVTKWWETRELKKTLLEKITATLLKSWIHLIKWELQLSIWYGKEWYLWQNQKTKYARWVWAWVWWDRGPWWTVGIFVDLSGEIAEQYNFKSVINADLSDIKSAKYLGLEWSARASVDLKNIKGWVDVGASGGINRQRDPVAWINQIDKQYTNISAEIFTVKSSDIETVLSSQEACAAYFTKIITQYTTDKTYWAFVTTNKQHLLDNMNFMVKYMAANKIFGVDSILAKKTLSEKKLALNALIDIIQTWNREERRHDVIAGLHGKISLTKLSFWLTTSLLTAKSGKNTGGETQIGICGVYIGGKISTWKNSYTPNVAQYLFTEYETGNGIGTESMTNPGKNPEKYAQYLEAIYNDDRLSCTVDAGRLMITFDAWTSGITLAKFLNIHATAAAQKSFSLKGNVLIIGNVWDIGAYTITQANGVRRILSLGTEKLDDATPVTWDNTTTTVDAISFTETWNKDWTAEKITTDIISNMIGVWVNVEIAKKETQAFFDTTGKLQTPTGAEWTGKIITFSPTTIEKTALKNWTLTITKNADGINYTVEFIATPADKMTITYIDKKEYDVGLSEAAKITTNRETTPIASAAEVKTAFTMPTNISSVFVEKTEQALSIFDDYQNTLYKSFMESAVDVWLDTFIDATDYATAFTNLQNILDKNTKYSELIQLKTLMEGTLTAAEKMLIVDKFKTIFSYITYLTDGKADGTNLSTEIKRRWKIYQTMKWPDGTKYPLTTDYRTTILSNLKSENSLTRTCVENLIGFTAFYKLDGKGRKYAMTPVWWTNVLTWSSLAASMIELTDTDKVSAADWFVKNLDVNTDNKKSVLAKINILLKKENITITDKDLSTLLTSGELIIDTSKKIHIDLRRMFYLLGECGNESFWVEIGKIDVIKLKNNITGTYTATGTPEKEYTTWTHIHSKNHSISSEVTAKELKLWVKLEQWIPPKKQKDKEQDNQYVEDENDNQNIDNENDNQYVSQ